MNLVGGNYPMPQAEQSALVGPMSTTERLKERRERLKAELAQVEEAITALEESPEVARAVDAISKIGGF